MKRVLVGVAVTLALVTQGLVGQTAPHVQLGIVSDWTQHHVLTPEFARLFLMARMGMTPLGAELVSPPLGRMVEGAPSQASPAAPQRLERAASRRTL